MTTSAHTSPSGTNGVEAAREVRPPSQWTRGFLYATCGLFVVNGIQLLGLSGSTVT